MINITSPSKQHFFLLIKGFLLVLSIDLGTKFWLELHPSVSDIYSTMCAYDDGWACSIKVHASRSKVLIQ